MFFANSPKPQGALASLPYDSATTTESTGTVVPRNAYHSRAARLGEPEGGKKRQLGPGYLIMPISGVSWKPRLQQRLLFPALSKALYYALRDEQLSGLAPHGRTWPPESGWQTTGHGFEAAFWLSQRRQALVNPSKCETLTIPGYVRCPSRQTRLSAPAT
jgi:hypothetical protein